MSAVFDGLPCRRTFLSPALLSNRIQRLNTPVQPLVRYAASSQFLFVLIGLVKVVTGQKMVNALERLCKE